MGIHNDAIAVTTTQATEDADFVLQDLLNWSRQALGMREQITPFSRIFESHLVVEFDGAVERAFDMYAAVTKGFGSVLQDLYQAEVEPRFSRISFSIEATPTITPLVRSEIWIERRAGAPYSQNRYFSACGVQTAQHLHILEAFEGASKQKKK
jgi:hypothetical protein